MIPLLTEDIPIRCTSYVHTGTLRARFFYFKTRFRAVFIYCLATRSNSRSASPSSCSSLPTPLGPYSCRAPAGGAVVAFFQGSAAFLTGSRRWCRLISTVVSMSGVKSQEVSLIAFVADPRERGYSEKRREPAKEPDERDTW